MRFSVYKQNIVGNVLMISGLISMALGILILNVFTSIEDTGAAIAFLGIILSFLGLFVNADIEESFSRINKNYLKSKRFRDIVNPEDDNAGVLNRGEILKIDSDGEIAEKDAISVLKDPKYKHLIK